MIENILERLENGEIDVSGATREVDRMSIPTPEMDGPYLHVVAERLSSHRRRANIRNRCACLK